MTKNDIQKKLIFALANAPKKAIQELYATATAEEQKQLEKIAKALKIEI